MIGIYSFIALLVFTGTFLHSKPLIPENRERSIIVGAGYTEGKLAGLELGFNLRWGNLVINSYYAPPADRTSHNLSFLTESIEHGGEYRGQIPDGTLYLNARWLVPVYKSIYLSGSVGLASVRYINIYRDTTYNYLYGVLSHEQRTNAGIGVTWRPVKNLGINYEYNYLLKSMVSLNYYWILNEPESID